MNQIQMAPLTPLVKKLIIVTGAIWVIVQIVLERFAGLNISTWFILPIIQSAGESMDQQNRFAIAVDFIIDLCAVERGEVSGGDTLRRNGELQGKEADANSSRFQIVVHEY